MAVMQVEDGSSAHKTALVVGATSGIGKALVKTLLSSGIAVLATSRSRTKIDALLADLSDLQKEKLTFIDLDFSLNHSYERLEKILNDKSVRVDYYVNCIGEASNTNTFKDAALFEKSFNVNFLMVVKVTNMVIDKMIECGKGRLVLIGSLSTHSGIGEIPYICSKVALESFVLNVSRKIAEIAPEVVLNMVSPGPVDVPGKGLHRLAKEDKDGLRNWLRQNRIQLDRLATPDEVAECINFLLTAKTTYLHGANLHIDAGGHNF